MDTWPGFCEQQNTITPEKKKGKAKAEEKRVEEPWRYPVLDHGTLGAASLKKARQKTVQRYSWSFAADDVSGTFHPYSLRYVRLNQHRITVGVFGGPFRGLSPDTHQAFVCSQGYIASTCRAGRAYLYGT